MFLNQLLINFFAVFNATVSVSGFFFPNNLWLLSCVESVVKGVDHEIRGATVKLGNGNLLLRPLVKLFPLEWDTYKDITTMLNETIDSHSYAEPSVPIREG